VEPSPEKLRPWFRLKAVPGIGNLLFRRLIQRFATPEAVFAAGDEDLRQVSGMRPELVAALRRPEADGAAAAAEIDRALGCGYRLVTQIDPAYPPLLLEIPDPPPFLYVSGDLDGCRCAVAVVGSRHATPYGLETTRRLSGDLARQGITVVSGLARGIDTAAHQGALQARGRTVAVLGSGLECLYPRENRALARRIAASGAVVSELPLDAEPDAHHFPQRNRIISGLSLGTVVVEATRRSGSLITARLAAEHNREVFAVPGSIQSFKSIGTHALIKEGAKLVTHAGDILEELPVWARMAPPETPAAAPTADSPPPRLSTDETRVLARLTAYPTQADDLTRSLAMAPGQVASLLLGLELKGLVRQEPGKRFCLAQAPPADQS
jgi:DNA processing protein